MDVNKKIINKLIEKDNDTFELVYYEYKDLVYFVAFSILKNHNDSEEIVQDVFVKMLKEIEKFDGRFFKAWLLKITKNLAINKYRSINKEDSISDDELGNFSSIDENILSNIVLIVFIIEIVTSELDSNRPLPLN